MRILTTLTLVLAASMSATAFAQPNEVVWSEDWARVHPAGYSAVLLAPAAAFAFAETYQPPLTPTLRGPFALLDAEVREAMMLRGAARREAAAGASDILLLGLLAWPLTDALGVAGLAHQSGDVAWQLLNIALEVAAADYVLSTIVKLLVHRERPHGERCVPGERSDRCEGSGRTRGFYSGHVSAAFSSAGLVCMTHAHLDLYGSRAADWTACAAAMSTATVVGLLRIAADRHYLSDVIVGSLVGLALGLLLPYALHFGWNPPEPAPAPAPLAAPPQLHWSGTF